MNRPRRADYHRTTGLATRVLCDLALVFLVSGPGCGGGGQRRVAAGGPTAPPPPVILGANPPFFVPGETITWQLTFMGIEGGRARLAVGMPGVKDGRRTVVLVAEAESSGLFSVLKQVRDVTESWIDADSGLPTRTESQTDQAGKTVHVHAVHKGEARADMTVWRDGQGGATHAKRLPSLATHDPLSALLLLRGWRSWRAAPGQAATFYSLGGLRLWRTDVSAEGQEVVRGPLGAVSAQRLVGRSTRLTGSFDIDTSKKPRTFTLWVSDDDYRVPLRVVAETEYGDVRIDATSYQAGQAAQAGLAGEPGQSQFER